MSPRRGIGLKQASAPDFAPTQMMAHAPLPPAPRLPLWRPSALQVAVAVSLALHAGLLLFRFIDAAFDDGDTGVGGPEIDTDIVRQPTHDIRQTGN